MSTLDTYSRSYDDLFVHQLMLQDLERVEAYKRSFEENKELFKGKIVLDVGCGTGILSMLAAKCGAKAVYAVDGSNISFLAKTIVEDNELSEIVKVIHGVIEEIELPVNQVDIIVSEWMGFYLLHEGMLDSVIFARDKWLDPKNGLIFPEKASLYVSLVEIEDFWYKNIEGINNIQGFDYSSMRRMIHSSYLKSPLILGVEPKNVENFSFVRILSVDLLKININDLDIIESRFTLKVKKDTEFVHGFIIWFDVEFPAHNSNVTILSTSPYNKPTHWKQTIMLFQDCIEAKAGLNIKCVSKLERCVNESKRCYTISIEVQDASIEL
ncbi:Ribosomal protein L11 methyltransferase (PrmA) family protein [Cryptosporidium meleagridis]|uniref:type I protein arginine methyltransferase n=1 Tax=Cryptosporidium meleagridis TaxID=93969 RepID=A0A2P4Z483_9CRYT|nr:Ribosomal protein L11 methyltransferase (PrmA) family protein [Cryptosporidium meleagridis]